MKKIKVIFLLSAILTTIASCHKDGGAPVTPTGFTIVHAWVGGSKLVADFYDGPMNYYSAAPQISYGAFLEYSPLSGSRPLTISQITDTTHFVYRNTLNLDPNAIYSLFLTGQSSTPDTLFTRDTLAYHAVTDSVVGIRFVNLSPASNPVSVNIKGNAYGSEVGSLAYKTITSFKTYPAPATITKYIFEIRDAVSGALLYTYTYSGLARFRNITLVLKGVVGGTGTAALGVFVVNNF